jgi:hypothetical protein
MQASLSGEAEAKFREMAFTRFSDATDWIKTFRDKSVKKHFTAAVAEVIDSRQRRGQTAQEYLQEQTRTFRTEYGSHHDKILIAILIPRLNERISNRFGSTFEPTTIEELIAESSRIENESTVRIQSINSRPGHEPTSARRPEEAIAKEAQRDVVQLHDVRRGERTRRMPIRYHPYSPYARASAGVIPDLSKPPPAVLTAMATTTGPPRKEGRGQPPGSTPSEGYTSTVKCFACKGDGHMANQCQYPRKN